jgi:hypothetical protein
MAEMERMTAEEVVRHLLEDADGADLVLRGSLPVDSPRGLGLADGPPADR